METETTTTPWRLLDVTNGVTTELGQFRTRALASLALVQTVIANEGNEDWSWIEGPDGLATEWIGSTREADSYRIEEVPAF